MTLDTLRSMRVRSALLAFVLPCSLAACSSGDKDSGAASPAATATATPIGSSTANGIAIKGLQNDTFDITEIHTKPGELKVQFSVPGPTPHNFEVEGVVGARIGLISNGQKATSTFTLAPGTYTFVCTIHDGMQGTIVVAP